MKRSWKKYRKARYRCPKCNRTRFRTLLKGLAWICRTCGQSVR